MRVRIVDAARPAESSGHGTTRRASLLGAAASGLLLPATFAARRANAQSRRLVVGFSIWDQTFPFIAAFANALRAAATRNNIDLRLVDPKMDASVQAQEFQEFVVQRVDVIGVTPVDVRAIKPAAAAARAAGVPVIGMGGHIEGFPYIGSDDVEFGRQMGRLIVQALDSSGTKGAHRLAFLRGDAGGRVDRERGEGIKEILAGRPDISVAAEVFTDWVPDKGLSAVQDLLQRFGPGELSLIHGWGGAVEVRGARYAHVTAGRPEVLFTGGELGKQTAEAIAAGQEFGVALQDPVVLANTMIEALPRMAPKFDSVPADVVVPLPIATKANLADFKPF